MTGNVLAILEAGLDAAALRQKVIANNIANISTPGYKAGRVRFEDELRSYLTGQGKLRLSVTHPGHIGVSQGLPAPTITRVNRAMRPDGNSVNMDSEQVMLADNVIRFQALAAQVDEQLARMRLVVTEGRG